MRKRTYLLLLLVLLQVGVALVAIRAVRAQEDGFALLRSVIGSGGMGGAAGEVRFAATLGQPVAGSPPAGDLALGSGFWAGLQAAWDRFRVFLPLAAR